jgi:hypothetical protein
MERHIFPMLRPRELYDCRLVNWGWYASATGPPHLWTSVKSRTALPRREAFYRFCNKVRLRVQDSSV